MRRVTQERRKVRIYCCDNYQAMSRKAANIISAQVIMQPDCVLGLATGSTPIGIYQQLIEWFQKGDLDFSTVKTVNLDEYKGLSPENKQSYHYFMWENLFRHVNLNPDNTYLPNGLANDVQAECERYNQVIAELHGVDMQLLGIGHNGHIGFNEPGQAFEKDTHCVKLTESTIEANSRLFGAGEEVPRYAFTMGIRSIMQARRILLAVSGEDKAEIIKRALFGSITPEVPASILQFHKDVTLVGDKAALKYIPEVACTV